MLDLGSSSGSREIPLSGRAIPTVIFRQLVSFTGTILSLSCGYDLARVWFCVVGSPIITLSVWRPGPKMLLFLGSEIRDPADVSVVMKIDTPRLTAFLRAACQVHMCLLFSCASDLRVESVTPSVQGQAIPWESTPM